MPDTSKARLTPDAAARCALKALEQAGRPERAAGAAAYFKAYQSVQFYGVDSPTVRKMASEIRRDHARDWQLADAVRFADALISKPQLEAKGLGVCVLGRFRGDFDAKLLARAKRWLQAYCHDWASTDSLCGEVLGPLLLAHPDLLPQLRTWRRSRALYVRRASAVALILPVRRQVRGALDEAYSVALELGDDREDLIQKALGWLLREAGKPDSLRLEKFLRQHGSRLGRTTVRYAIERFAPPKRRALLEVTKPASGLRAS